MPSHQSEKPLAIDLYAGLGGWSEGLLAEGFRAVGFDIEQHQYGEHRYPAQLVIQDVRTLHGSQFKGAALIVASPPCQEFSYMAMPWSLAKAKRAAILADTSGVSLAKLTELFDTCFRIQREASEAAGHHIPLIVENVRGAQEWVGRARWSFGSFYLWGDVPALMPYIPKAVLKAGVTHCNDGSTNFHGTKVGGFSWSDFGKPDYKPQAFNGTAERNLKCNEGIKVGNAAERRWENRPVKRLRDAYKVPSESGRRTDVGKGVRFTSRDCGVESENAVVAALEKAGEGRKGYAKVLGQSEISRKYGSKSPQRKMASAMIAKIPTVLSRHIASTFMPK